MKKINAFLMVAIMIVSFAVCKSDSQISETDNIESETLENSDVSEVAACPMI